jgi:hypothetical protein
VAGIKSDVAHAMTTENSNVRADRIDDAVGAASELIAALMDLGPVAPAQAKLIMVAAARAAVTNIEEFEVRDSATRVVTEIEGERQKRLGARSED